jgi:hypothetical protein
MSTGVVCEECGAFSRDAQGWRAMFYLTGVEVSDVSAHASLEDVAVYCADCAAREFGEPQPARHGQAGSRIRFLRHRGLPTRWFCGAAWLVQTCKDLVDVQLLTG